MRTIKENKYEKFINQAIIDHEKNKMINTNNISDGQHTFGELYEHRAKLFSVICNRGPSFCIYDRFTNVHNWSMEK